MNLLCAALTGLLFSSFAAAAPNYVDCTNTSTPFSDQRLGSEGFGIINELPAGGIVLSDFVYGKQEEKAWAKMIAQGSIYRVTANCQQKIKNGVWCAFDLASAKEEGTSNGGLLSDSVTELFAAVIDKELSKEWVEILFSVGTEKPVPYQSPRFKNMIDFDNYSKNNCQSLEKLEQG